MIATTALDSASATSGSATRTRHEAAHRGRQRTSRRLANPSVRRAVSPSDTRIRQGRIELLNRSWHERVRPRARFGTCAGCDDDVVADDRAVYVQGELYHVSCALYRRRM
jgi:ribosome biogenesis protein Tsr3